MTASPPASPATSRVGMPLAAVLDGVLILVFAAVGRASHDEANPVIGARGDSAALPGRRRCRLGSGAVAFRSLADRLRHRHTRVVLHPRRRHAPARPDRGRHRRVVHPRGGPDPRRCCCSVGGCSPSDYLAAPADRCCSALRPATTSPPSRRSTAPRFAPRSRPSTRPTRSRSTGARGSARPRPVTTSSWRRRLVPTSLGGSSASPTRAPSGPGRHTPRPARRRCTSRRMHVGEGWAGRSTRSCCG